MRVPPCVSEHRHRVVADRKHMADPCHAGNCIGLERYPLSAKGGTCTHCGIEHTRQTHVACIDRTTKHLVWRVKPSLGTPDQRPLFRLFQSYIWWHRALSRGSRDLTEAKTSPTRSMADH